MRMATRSRTMRVTASSGAAARAMAIAAPNRRRRGSSRMREESARPQACRIVTGNSPDSTARKSSATCRFQRTLFDYGARRNEIMEYLLLIYGSETRWAGLSKEETESEMAGYGAFGQEFAGAIKGGNALQATGTATTVRVRDGKRLTTDGPFAETKEQLGGFYLVEANNLDDAIEMAAKIPGARFGSVEVRPIETFGQ